MMDFVFKMMNFERILKGSETGSLARFAAPARGSCAVTLGASRIDLYSN